MSQYLECDMCKMRINPSWFHIELEMQGELIQYKEGGFFDQGGYAHLCQACSNEVLEILYAKHTEVRGKK